MVSDIPYEINTTQNLNTEFKHHQAIQIAKSNIQGRHENYEASCERHPTIHKARTQILVDFVKPKVILQH